MSSTKEIITFQIGHYSNFVGTHWWNIQESSFCYDPSQAESQPVNHAVLFREGQNIRGETTFTPRLIALDLKGSLKTLPQEGTLYSAPSSSNSFKWLGQVDIQTEPSESKNEFLQEMEKREHLLYSTDENILPKEHDSTENDLLSLLPKKYNLDQAVSVWSDFLHTRLHPRSILLIEEYHHNNEIEQFDFFGCGSQVALKEQFREAVQNQIRNFAEESDYLQGFNIVMDGYNGFAGIASSVLQHLEEEYGQKTQICYPLFQPSYKISRPGEARSEEAYRLLTSLLCLETLSSVCSLFSPLSLGQEGLFQGQQESVHFSHLSYRAELQYHTSAILASALDTLTLPSRLKNSPTHLADFAHQMSYGNRKLVSSHVCLPLPLHQGESFSHMISHGVEGVGLQPLTPLSQSQNALIQSIVFRGIPEGALRDPKMPGAPVILTEETIARHISALYPSAAIFLKNVSSPCQVVDPFPHIFSSNIGGNGLIQTMPRPDLIGVQHVPMFAAHRNSSCCSQHVERLLESAKKIRVSKFHRCLEMNVESDDIKEAINSLEGFSDNYRDSGFLIEG